MALDTYANLQASLTRWIKRADLVDVIPDFISLAEARINRELRVERMLTRLAMSISAEFTTAPTDLAGPRSMRLTASNPNTVLSFLTPEQMADYARGLPTGTPSVFGIVGQQLWVLPAQTAAVTIELTYFAKVPALSSTNTSNWVLASHPDIYLWGGLLEASLFMEDDEAIARYAPLFEDAINDLRRLDLRDSMGATLSPSPAIQPA